MTYTLPFVAPIPQLNGPGSINQMPEIFKSMNCKKILVMFDKGVESTGIPQKIADILKKENFEVILNNSVGQDAADENAAEITKQAKEEDVDCLVAVGGGSAMDTGKVVKLMKTNPGVVSDYFDDLAIQPEFPMIPLVVIR